MSANVGGYLRGPWWKYVGSDKETTRRCFVIAWGNIVKNPEEHYKELRVIRFAIKTGRGAGRSEKHLVCVGYGERMSTVVMRAMEKGDIVLVCGTWVEMESKTKKGIKPTYECRVNFILPLSLVGFLLDLYCTPSIQRMVEEHKNEDSDPFESDDDTDYTAF